MGLHLVDIYRSPNIGVFLKGNDRTLLVPKGLAPTKCDKFSKDLEVTPVPTSIGESRLLGPLVALNGNGALVSRLAEQAELAEIERGAGISVARLESKLTSAGNLIVANDKFALISPALEPKVALQVRDVLGTEVERMAIGEFHQVGSLVVATNGGAAVFPGLSESEVSRIGEMFGVEAYPTSVNNGVPFVASGLVANSRNAIVGNQTTGPELVFITRALKV
jgi:translation initiation factor 6